LDRIHVDSSNLVDIGYDPSSMTLEVGFKNGTLYQYFDVPETVYQQLMQAESHGTFFNANVRNSYRYLKL